MFSCTSISIQFMRKSYFSLLFASLCCTIVMGTVASCDDAMSFTTDRNAVLTFSTDTIQFDTVISTVGSSTRQMMVYNYNDDGIRIVSVRLHKGENTPFRVNVDGSYLEKESGAKAYDFEVRKGDSIRVFAEVTMPENGQDAPVILDDTLIFSLESGAEQSVILSATGQDAYIWKGKEIAADTVLEKGRPFVIYDSLSVKEGATLTLKQGVQLYFHDKSNLIVHGRIVAEGTLEQLVVFRGDRTDRMFDYLPYDNTPSRWGGILLKASSMDNRMDYVDIHSASYGIRCDSSTVEQVKLTLSNSVLHNIGGDGLGLYSCKVLVSNSQISNTLGHCVAVWGGWVDFVHCTLAQFYPWDAERGDALFFSNQWMSQPYPLRHAHFLNCIMTGYADDVVTGSIDDPDNNVDYYFGNCLLRTAESTDAARFVNIVYDKDSDDGGQQKHFKLFDTDNYLYNFRLDSLSAARNIGAMQWAEQYPVDYDGNSRVSDEGPDAGCYEFVSASEE